MSDQNSTESNDQFAAAAAAAAAASSGTTPSEQQPQITGDSNEYKDLQEQPERPEDDDDNDCVIELKDGESGKKIQVELHGQSSSSSADDDIEKEAPAADIKNNSDGRGDEDDSGRERLKRHHKEVGGRVWIPEKWGKEELLKDWIDCSAFNASLVPTGIMSARAALIQEGSPPKFRWN